MQARKASQRDWLVLTHHETRQEKAGRGHTESRTERTTKEGSERVHKVNSRAETEEQRSACLARAPELTACRDVYDVDASVLSKLLNNSSMLCLCFFSPGFDANY